MFGLLNTTQIYGIQQHQIHDHEQQQKQFHLITNSLATPTTTTSNTNISNPNYQQPYCRSHSSVTDTGHRFFASLATKNPTNFIEKFLKTDLQSTYDTIKSYHRNYPANNQNTTTSNTNKRHSDPLHYESGSKLTAFNCLQGSYRHSFDGEFYVPVKINNNNSNSNNNNKNNNKDSEMTIKCSKNLLAVDAVEQGPATLQNYQKIPESEHDLLVDSLVASSGASSGEFNSSSDGNATTGNSSSSSSSGNSGSSSLSSSNLYKRLSFGGRNSQNSKSEKNGDCNMQSQQQQQQQQQQNAVPTDNSITLNLSASSIIPSVKSIELQRSSSSTSSSGDFLSKRERKKGAMTPQPEKTPLANLLTTSCLSAKNHATSNTPTSPEKAQRRRLLQMLTSYDQQNKFLQRELAKEKRRRTEELACVVKSLLCFEAKLKNDMKAVNQRLQDKDTEICRLVRQNRALRKKLNKLQQEARESVQDEGVVEDNDEDDADADANDVNEDDDKDLKDLLEDCLVLEALQCINCRKQFYDIEVTDNCTQTQGANSLKDSNGKRNNDDPTTEHGSSSDDTVSSSFFGARRSVRYTSKRTSGTFRDYMRSRAMNIDDPALENDINAGEDYATQASYEKLNIYSRTMERMHGVKSESERDSEHSGLDCSSSITRSNSRASTKSSKSTISTATSKASEISHNLEEDDGIFSPTQDEDFDEELLMKQETKMKTVRGSALEAFSEASPKQIYETSLDDWYASNSDQEEISASAAVTSKSYGQGAVNPVLECVNQILLQQSMEGVEERSQTPKNSNHTINNTTLPRRSSLSDRRNQRSNSRASDSCLPGSRSGTLTRKRVHFSTKNSMVHVPRNDETEEDEEELKSSTMISNYQGMTNAAAYITHSPVMDSHHASTERLETFNYESIYSNEYEPIGSELNSSNLYVDMDSNSKTHNLTNEHNSKNNANKLPPALPPKPANLLKFKKSLQQLDESPDELMEAHNNTTEILVEPDYCSISEVNVGITSVQIRADIHRAPLSERDLESVIEHENDLDAATEISEANSHKTEEIEEIFADIPKLPNVAAIIAPKSSLKQNDYLIMTPKQDNKLGIMALAATNNTTTTTTATSNAAPNNMLLSSTPCNKPDRKALKLNLSPINGILTNTALKANKTDCNSVLRPQLSTANYQQQYKRKHMPNILQEINKRLSLPNSPITPTTPKGSTCASSTLYNKSITNDADCLNSLPLQAEFDWYNLDAEYGKNTQTELHKNNENLNTVVMPTLLADIKEDGESLITTADEYNLDEEYKNEMEQEESAAKNHYIANDLLCEAINHTSSLTKATKIKKNLANFEKFIETTSLTSKPLPTKRKIYFAGPFV